MTLRARLTLWFTVAVAAAMSLYGVFVYVTVEQRFVEQFDRDLHADHERAETMLVWAGSATWDPTLARPREHDGEPAPTVSITGAGGRLVYESPDYADDGSTRIGEWSHVVTAASPSPDTETVVIRVARSLAPLREELRTLLFVLLVGLALGVGLAGAAGSFLAWRALLPVAAMADRARRITADHLAERLPVQNDKDELGRLATVFNQTLERLESSFDRLRRFTADASHELRTPLTAIRAVGEVALRESRSSDECRAVIASMLEEADRLTRLVDDLLSLSRADAGEARLVRQDVDLAELAREVANHLAVLAEEKRMTLDVSTPHAVIISADRAVLRRAVVNLLDNAIQYSPTGSAVHIEVRSRGESAVLEVTDQGPGIPAEHHARIFDRFYRVDRARARQSGGTGLGLAIARWAVAAHGGSIDLASTPGQGCTFRILLPRATAGVGIE